MGAPRRPQIKTHIFSVLQRKQRKNDENVAKHVTSTMRKTIWTNIFLFSCSRSIPQHTNSPHSIYNMVVKHESLWTLMHPSDKQELYLSPESYAAKLKDELPLVYEIVGLSLSSSVTTAGCQTQLHLKASLRNLVIVSKALIEECK